MSLEIKHLQTQTHELMESAGNIIDEISRLRAENAELKHKLDDAKATAYAESVDAGMENRRLRRALYKACANWMINRQSAMSCFHLEARAKKFDKAIDKCRSMAERYK